MRIHTGLVEHEQSRTQAESLGDVVGDHEDGQTQFAVQFAHEVVHVRPDSGVEGTEWFVEQQDAGLGDQGLCQRQALLHAAGEFRRIVCCGRQQAHPVEHRLGAFHVPGPATTEGSPEEPGLAELQAEQHVAEHGQVWKHRVALEHDAAVRAGFRHKPLPGDLDHALAGFDLAEQHAQKRGLAAARSADDGHELVLVDLEPDVLEHRLARVALPHVADLHQAHVRSRTIS